MTMGAGLLTELKRRKVFRVAVVYAATVFVILQAADIMLPRLGVPDWAMTLIVVLVVLGFPVALVMGWALELTPEGVKVAPRRGEESSDDALPSLLGKRTVLVAGAMVILGIGLGAGWFLRPAPPPLPEATVDESPAVRTLAVLPFAALSAGEDDGFFADGLTDEIINSLTALPELLVTARTSSFHFKGRDVPVPDVARTLGVGHVVEGSVRRSGDRLRITAQLIRAVDGFHLWSANYDRELKDIFAVQLDIAQRIAESLDVVLDDEQRRRMEAAGIRNVEAFLAFQQGYALYDEAHRDVSRRNAVLVEANEWFRKVIEHEPQVWLAHFFHSDLYLHYLADAAMGLVDPVVTPELLAEAERQVAIDLAAARRHAPMPEQRRLIDFTRSLFSGDWTGLGEAADELFATTGCLPTFYQSVMAIFDRAEAAGQYMERQLACDPLNEDHWDAYSMMPLLMGEPQATVEIAARAPPRPEAFRYSALYAALARIALGEHEQAEAMLTSPALSERHRGLLRIAVNASQGRAETARQAAASLSEREGPDGLIELISAAWLGDRATANAVAARIDARRSGPATLLNISFECFCGAPFDLEATPRLRAQLEQARLPWPPRTAIDWPLKDW